MGHTIRSSLRAFLHAVHTAAAPLCHGNSLIVHTVVTVQVPVAAEVDARHKPGAGTLDGRIGSMISSTRARYHACKVQQDTYRHPNNSRGLQVII